MVGANGPVRGPHPVRASGKSVKDDSSPVRGPHPIRAIGQGKEIQDGLSAVPCSVQQRCALTNTHALPLALLHPEIINAPNRGQ